MPLEFLKTLVPPPALPFEAGCPKDWGRIEKELGTELPADYREFISCYGSGLFARFYRIYNPFAASKWTHLGRSVPMACGFLRELRLRWKDEVPYPIYPECGGLLPWGNDENGNYYFWVTDGPPDSWSIASYEVRGRGFEGHSCTMSNYLADVLSGRIPALAGSYPTSHDRVFEAWNTAEF